MAERRRDLFVGRSAEIELFRAALHAPEPPFSVLFLHGPGGIGKSSLLDRLIEYAEEAGAKPVRVEVAPLTAMPDALARAARELPSPHSEDVSDDPAVGRLVLVVDALERAGPASNRIREELVAALPGDAIAVLACRTPPGDAWADPAWQERLRSVGVRGLSRPESRELLRRSGIAGPALDELAGLAHGHPLALCLLAEVARADGSATVATGTPMTVDIVTALLHRFVDTVPGPQHRRALEACALARVTTEPLLRAALVLDDAHELFEWLRGLSFVDAGPDGLQLHDLARDVLDLDLRWRDPEQYRQVFRRVRGHIHRASDSADPQQRQRALLDVKFIFRNLPGVLSPVDWASWGLHQPEQATAADRAQILALVAAFEGERAAAIARHWLDRQPEGFVVLREHDGGLRGFLGLLDLTAAAPDDVAADPVTAAAWRHAVRSAPLRPGEIVTQTRFVVDRERYQAPSPTLNATPVVTLERYLQMRALAFDFLTLAEPDTWDEYFALAGLPRVPEADVAIDGHRFGLFCHDFRAEPVSLMIQSWEERVLAGDVRRPEPVPPAPVVPAKADFADEVRQALRDLRRPDLLARSALLRTRLMLDRAAPSTPDGRALAALLVTAVRTLREDPRDDRLWQAVRRTYLEPAGTQESAAASLGLPFSTYRRHLTRGLARVVDWCWEREIHGWPAEQD